MPMTRRQFLHAATGVSLLCTGTIRRSGHSDTHYLSAYTDAKGHNFISGFNQKGHFLFQTPLPDRGHAIAVSPITQDAVAIARRPGRYLIVIDTKTGQIRHRMESHAGRHFYGHGVFSQDGQWFYTTENDFTNGQGVIGVWDVQRDYQPVDTFLSHGIGPHELIILSDGRTLAVANGGIQTHPDTGRAKLNLEQMQPSLTYLDSHQGTLLEQHCLPPVWHKNSIRHLAATPDDCICFVMQYQGPASAAPPLIGLHRKGQPVQLLYAPKAVQKSMRNYCGSVCADTSGTIFAVSSPKGGVVTFWQAKDGHFLGYSHLIDGCGIAKGQRPGTFLLSNGAGRLIHIQIGQQQLKTTLTAKKTQIHWDNHMTHIPVSSFG